MSAETDRYLSRREALGAFTFAGLVAMFGSSVAAPLARAADAGGPGGWTPSHAAFDKGQRAFVTAWSGRIVPKTDTPGAIEAGVPTYIEMMVADWFNDDERSRLFAGLSAVEAYCQATYKKPFAKLRASNQDAVITAVMNGKMTGASWDFYSTTRQMVLTGYYTSEIGMTVERIYLPVPGDYDGAYDYAKAGRILNG